MNTDNLRQRFGSILTDFVTRILSDDCDNQNINIVTKEVNATAEGLVIAYLKEADPSKASPTSAEPVYKKQSRYLNGEGKLDHIDECARDLSPEEFRGAMKFTSGKYLKRLGKKDSIIQELEKIHDYIGRWLAYERKQSSLAIRQDDTQSCQPDMNQIIGSGRTLNTKFDFPTSVMIDKMDN